MVERANDALKRRQQIVDLRQEAAGLQALLLFKASHSLTVTCVTCPPIRTWHLPLPSLLLLLLRHSCGPSAPLAFATAFAAKAICCC